MIFCPSCRHQPFRFSEAQEEEKASSGFEQRRGKWKSDWRQQQQQLSE